MPRLPRQGPGPHIALLLDGKSAWFVDALAVTPETSKV
jgi:hypothetical protein